MRLSPDRLNQIAILLQAVAFLFVTPEVIGSENMHRIASLVGRKMAPVATGLGRVGMGGLVLGRYAVPFLLSSLLSLWASFYVSDHFLPAPVPAPCVPSIPSIALFPTTLPTLGKPVWPPLLATPLISRDILSRPVPISTTLPHSTVSGITSLQSCDPMTQAINTARRMMQAQEQARQRQQTRTRIMVLSLPLAVGLTAFGLALVIGRIIWLLDDNPRLVRRLTRFGAAIFFSSLLVQFASTLIGPPR